MAWGSQGQVFLGEDLMHTRDYSEDTSRVIDDEVERILRGQEERAMELLTRHRGGLDAVARALLEQESIDGAEVGRLVDEAYGKPVHANGPKAKTVQFNGHSDPNGHNGHGSNGHDGAGNGAGTPSGREPAPVPGQPHGAPWPPPWPAQQQPGQPPAWPSGAPQHGGPPHGAQPQPAGPWGPAPQWTPGYWQPSQPQPAQPEPGKPDDRPDTDDR